MSDPVIEPQPVKVTNWPSGGCGCMTALAVVVALFLAVDMLWAIENVQEAVEKNTKAIEALPHSTPPVTPTPSTPAAILGTEPADDERLILDAPQ